ncbi:MAG: hypothetical protein NTY38_33360 [Acidobacteria bacterium]|nr:hypothetical protein [Acidobacteriota bacterium]
MRSAVLVFLALAGSFRGAQAPDAASPAEGEKREEETKFSAERLSSMASLNREAFLGRFAGWHGSGQARFDVTCRGTDQASLEATAVLAENQEIRVSAGVSAEASGPRTIVLAPCTILTNNINISPTAELAAPYAKSEAKNGPPQGRYRCSEENDNTFTGWLSIQPRNRYTQPTGEPGRYRFDDKLNRVFFRDGALQGWQAEFSISSKGRILILASTAGNKRLCSWQGQ